MKIGITGHTGGLGTALCNQLHKDNQHTLYGYSRATGYTFRYDTEAHLNCVENVLENDLDAFIMTGPMGQSKLLTELYSKWRELPDKHIIVVNSALKYQFIIDIMTEKMAENSMPKEDMRTNIRLWEAYKNCIFDSFTVLPRRKCRLSHYTLTRIATARSDPDKSGSYDTKRMNVDTVANHILERTLFGPREYEQLDILLNPYQS